MNEVGDVTFLVDHEVNRDMALALEQAPERLPIKITDHIAPMNALTTDWNAVVAPNNSTLVFGNPPFLGDATRNAEQAEELRFVWGREDIGRLDYVTGGRRRRLNTSPRSTAGGHSSRQTRSRTVTRFCTYSFRSVMSDGSLSSHIARLRGLQK